MNEELELRVQKTRAAAKKRVQDRHEGGHDWRADLPGGPVSETEFDDYLRENEIQVLPKNLDA